jgi:S1-C subfamily serine protease
MPKPSMTVLITVVLTVLPLSSIRPEQPNQQPPQLAASPAPSVGWLDEWRQVTVSFGTVERDPLQGDYYKVVGSGLIIGVGPTTAYIITAKHVFYEPQRNWHPFEIRLRYGWQDQKSVYAEHGSSLALRDASGKDLWTALSDESDIAAIPAPAPIIANQPALPLGVVAKPDEIFEGAAVIALGYPGIVGNEYLVRAISRGGIVAWLNPKDPFGSPFLIDANIYPGNSGGPIIKVPSGFDRKGNLVMGGRASLLGIAIQAPGQSGDYELRVPGQRQPLKIHSEIPVGGTGIVEPAAKITKLLELLSSKK